MYGYVVQDWLTLASASNAVLLQNESDWIALSSFQDIAFWIDVKGLTPPSGGNLLLELQTAPTRDDLLFKTISGCSQTLTTLPTSPTVVKNILSSNPAVPLATFVRWSITPSLALQWSLTFRILASANRVAA